MRLRNERREELDMLCREFGLTRGDAIRYLIHAAAEELRGEGK